MCVQVCVVCAHAHEFPSLSHVFWCFHSILCVCMHFWHKRKRSGLKCPKYYIHRFKRVLLANPIVAVKNEIFTAMDR